MKRLSTECGNPPPSELCLFSMLLLIPYFPHSPLFSSILSSHFPLTVNHMLPCGLTQQEKGTPLRLWKVFLEGLIAVFCSPKESQNTLISSCLMVGRGEWGGACHCLCWHCPFFFLVTKEETLEEDNASQIPQNKATFKKVTLLQWNGRGHPSALWGYWASPSCLKPAVYDAAGYLISRINFLLWTKLMILANFLCS